MWDAFIEIFRSSPVDLPVALVRLADLHNGTFFSELDIQ